MDRVLGVAVLAAGVSCGVEFTGQQGASVAYHHLQVSSYSSRSRDGRANGFQLGDDVFERLRIQLKTNNMAFHLISLEWHCAAA